MNTALERHYDFLPEYILTDTKSRECLTALASDIIRGQVFVPRLLSACRKYDPLADLSMYSNKAGLAKKIADSSLKSPELQRKLLHLWSRTAINVPFISKLPKDDMTWRQILLIYYQESKNKNDYPIESPILLSKILSKHNFPLSRDFKNLLDKYTSLLEIESLLYNLEPSTKLNINEKIDEFQKIAGVALSSEISPEALSRMADLFKNLENTIDQSFKKTHLALTYHQIILPELSFLQSLKSITPQQMAKGFLEEQQSFLYETQALFQSLFNRGGALAPFSALLLNLSKSELLNQRDHEEIDSYLKKISTLYTSMNLERTAPGAFVLAKLLCLPKPLKDEDLDCELPDLGYKFITSLKNGLLDPLAAPYLDNLALKELLFRPKVESPATPAHTLGEGDDEGQKLIRYPDRPKGSDSIAQISVVTPAPLGAGVSPPRESVEDTPKEAVFIEEPQGPPASIEELASLVRDEVTKTLEVSKGADHLDIMHFLPDEVSDALRDIAMRLLEHRDTGSLLWLAVATQSEAFPERLARVLHLGLNFQLGYPQLKSSLSALLEEPDSLMAPGTLDANQARLLLATAMLRPLVLSPDSLAHEIVRRLASVLSDFPPLLELFELFQEKILSCDEDYHATIRQIFYKENLEHSGELLKKKTEFYLQSSPSRKLGYKKATDLWQDIILGR
ncbi:MAG: hypothetical protein LBE27_02775, partial [Deltaproteobacteria bacterium]|nr:hypothetical protein [Deltaproteobacteria bacterium]